MAAPYHMIESKAEDALAATLATNATLTGLTVAKGFAGEDISIPGLLVYVESADPEVIGDTTTGNWAVNIKASVVTQCDDTTRAVHEGYAAEVRDVLVGTSGLVALINAEAITDFTALQWTPGQCRRSIEDEVKRVTEQDGVLYCAPSAL